jgi:DNA-binding transcriptional LysR family regulator
VARESHVSQSAVTRQIGQLEAHFGVRLFHRTTRRLSLTDDGQSLIDHARALLDQAATMESVLGSHRSSPTGLVRLGLTVAAGLFVAPRLPMLLARHPGLAVDLVMRDRITDLIEDRLDLALHPGDIADSSLIARRIGMFGRVPVASPAYLARSGVPAAPADLANHACVVHDHGGDDSATWRFNGPAGPVAVTVAGALGVNDSEAVRRVALAGYGIAMLPEIQVVDDVREGRLCRLLADYPSQRLPIHVVYPSRRNLAPRTRVVMAFLIEQIHEAGARVATNGGAAEA